MNDAQQLSEPGDLASALAWLAAEDPRQRSLAAKALGRQGPAVAAALPSLLKALEDVDPMVRSMVASALGRIGSPEAIPGLMARLADPVVPVRFWSVEALGRIATPAPGLADLLARLARDDEAHVRAAAARALARLRARPGSESA
jgi:HEAT repeat protein